MCVADVICKSSAKLHNVLLRQQPKTATEMARFTSRTLTAPIVAATMAVMLYVYSRTSIKAAKRNAERHRQADGGQISWQNENQRRHGKLERPVDPDTLTRLILGTEEKIEKALGSGEGGSQDRKRLREELGKKRGA